MSTVRAVVQPGWVAVSGPGVDALVAAAEGHVEPLSAAARGGLVALLEALTAHGLGAAPDLVAVAPTDTGVRVVVRGAAVAVLPDGTRVGSHGRLPWSDVDVDLAPDDEVVLEAPAPETPRGWRRPARFSRSDIPSDAVAAHRVEPEPEPAAEAAPEASVDPGPPVGATSAPPPDLTLPPPPDVTGLPPVARVPATPTPRGGLIESVPWRRPGGAPPAEPADDDVPAAPVPVPTEPLPMPSPHPEHARPPEPEPVVALQPPDADPFVPAAAEHAIPDHAREAAVPDVTTDRGALRRAEEDLDRPVVLAVLCPAGHPSPPHAGNCRSCGREIPPQQPFQTPRPSLGVLRISTGGSVPLDRGVLLGRAPRVNEELPANQRPHLIRVGGPDRDISRNHAEVVIEGWHVLVRDLGSTNGTTVALPGQEPVRLRPTEDQGIEPGTVVTLADEVVLTYEVEG